MTQRCPPPTRPLPLLRPGDVGEWTRPLVRIYSAGGAHPVTWGAFRHFGPHARMRFDHHPPPARSHPTRGIAYLSASWTTPDGVVADPLAVAVLECFGETGVIDRQTAHPRLVLWAPTRPLRLLRLTDSDWLARAGGNAALTSGARAVARAWSRAVYGDYGEVDGLIWASVPQPGGRSVALYERAADALPPHPSSHRSLDDPALQPALARIAHDYRLDLV